MRSDRPRPRDIPFIVDVVIGLALCATVTFFILVMEFHVGQGDLSAAQVSLLAPHTVAAHLRASVKVETGSSSQKTN